MTKTFLASVLLVLLLLATGAVRAEPAPPPDLLKWTALPPLPEGVSAIGAFAGVTDGALIVAGGGAGDRVFILRDRDATWTESKMRLATPSASGASVTADRGVICIAASDAFILAL